MTTFVQNKPKSWDDMTKRQQIRTVLDRTSHLEKRIDGTHNEEYCDWCQWLKRVHEEYPDE